MGIYTRSLGLLLIVSLFVGTEAIAQKKKKKKNKGKTEVVQGPLLQNELDSISYALGMGMAKNLNSSGVDSISSVVQL